jgi:hypothetical protein
MIISCGPISFLLSLIGLMFDRKKKPAILTLFILLGTLGLLLLLR